MSAVPTIGEALATPGLDPVARITMDTAIRCGGELMRRQVLTILKQQLDAPTALRITQLVMQVEVLPR